METVTTNTGTRSSMMEKIMNGVNLSKLMETVKAIQSRAELAYFKFRAKNRWVNGGHNKITVQDYYGACEEMKSRSKPFVLDADEPPVLLGTDKGPNPGEYLLTALSSCMTTTIAYHSAAQGLNVQEIEMEQEGDVDLHGFLDLDPKVRNGYKEIRVKVRVKGDPDQNQIKELVKKSPVYDSLVNPLPVKITVEKI